MKTFINSEAYRNEEVYDIVTDKFHDMKHDGYIEDWVEIEDLVINQDGDVYAVQHYHDTYFQTEGHGIHNNIESYPDMRTAVLVITQAQILAAIHNEVFYNIAVI